MGGEGNGILDWESPSNEALSWRSSENVQETANNSFLLKQNKFLGDEAMIWHSLTVKVVNLCVNYEEGNMWSVRAGE